MKSWKILFISGAVLLIAGGCRKKPIVPEFGMVVVDTVLMNGNRQFSVQYEFATITNAHKSPALEEIELANIRHFFQLEEFEGTAQEAFDESLRQFAGELAADQSAAEIPSEEQIILISTAEMVDSMLVYTISYASYRGGAHGIWGITATNYSLDGGYELMLDEFFDEPGREWLSARIREKLCEEYSAKNDDELVAAGFFPEYIGVVDNFAWTPEGITFYYNPYDIGCYALGGVEVNFTREELAEILPLQIRK